MKGAKMKTCVLPVFVVLLTVLLSPKVEAQAISCEANVGSGQPTGFALDNSGHIWVAFFQGNYLLEIQTSNCAVLNKISLASGPNGVAFDGTNIWVSSYYSNTISKVAANSGSLLATYAVGSGPRGVVFDGTFIWVANYNSNTVTKLQPSNGALLGNFPVGSGPFFMAVNATAKTIWVANRNSNNVMELNQGGGIQLTVATDSEPEFLTFDGTNMWVNCYNSGRVDKISPSGIVLQRISVSGNPLGLTWDVDDGLIWGVTHGGYLFSINPNTSAVSYTFLGGSSNSGYDILFDETFRFLWTTDLGGGIVVKVST
jgi:DNA-binding beta-propeller fold protein YncE